MMCLKVADFGGLPTTAGYCRRGMKIMKDSRWNNRRGGNTMLGAGRERVGRCEIE
ncbi:MAG TPA: hypothetical protein VEV87_04015 [Chitinophagaceae bacterium]|nr:hypothetical protein [Chitinophagaceae bacterium]